MSQAPYAQLPNVPNQGPNQLAKPYNPYEARIPVAHVPNANPTLNPDNDSNNPHRKRTKCQIVKDSLIPNFTWKSFTFWLTILHLTITAVTTIWEIAIIIKDKDTAPLAGTCLLYELGASYTPSIIVYYHLHRLVAPIFLHMGWAHCLGNMQIQLMYGFEQEKVFGTKKFILIYMLCGLGGSLFFGVFSAANVGIGASGALYGLGGVQICYLMERWKDIYAGRRIICVIMSGILFLGFQDMILPSNEGVQVAHHAHLGGMIFGFYVGFLFLTKNVIVKRCCIGLLALAIISLIVVMFMTPDNTQLATYLSKICSKVVFEDK